MSRNRHNNQSPVSLFPFLAVLISAMGALIFLLIVITNKVKHDVSASQQSPYPLPTASIEPAKPALTGMDISLPDPNPAPLKRIPPLPVQKVQPDVVELGTTASRTRAEAQLELDKLKQENQQWQDYLLKLDERLQAGKTKLQDLEKELLTKRQLLQKMQTEQDGKLQQSILLGEQTTKLEKQLAQFKYQVDQLQKTRDELGEKKKKVEYQAATRTSEWAIIPYEGTTGTTRRPIFLECTAEGITFQPEGITLKISELEQFTPRFNPVLSGVMVLREHWLKEDKKNNPEDARLPYILIIVRPSGILGFYGAQTLLQKIASPMGYELIEEDRPIAYPPKSTEAQQLLSQAIKETYSTKAKEFQTSPGGIPPGFGASTPQPPQDPRWSSRPGPAPQSTQDTGSFPGLTNPIEKKPAYAPGGLKPTTDNPQLLPPGPLEQGADNKPIMGDSKQGNPKQAGPTQENPTKPENTPSGSGDPAQVQLNENSGSGAESRVPTTTGKSTAGSTGAAPIISPVQKLEIQGEKATAGPTVGGNKKKTWGAANSRLIGLEQSILVKINDQKIQMGKRWIDVGQGETAKQIQDAVTEMANQEVDSWGPPPEGFRWVPSLKCQISPGGNTHYERFAQQLRREGYSVIAEQVFGK